MFCTVICVDVVLNSWFFQFHCFSVCSHYCYFVHCVDARRCKVQSAHQEKIPARNAMYAHAQDFAASDELLLAILKAFIPQPQNKQQTKVFHVF
jgi:hypothetical protein